MKKILSFILCAVLTLSAAAPAFAADKTGTYLVTADVVFIYSEATEVSQKTGEITKGKYITVTETAGPFGKAFFPTIGISGWVNMSALTRSTADDGKTDIIRLRLGFTGKTEFVQGEEELDLTGLTVYAVHKPAGGKEFEEEITGFKVYADSLKNLGDKTVTVTYSPDGTNTLFSAELPVKVIPVPVSSLTIVSLPAKTSYKEHETFDFTGLSLKVAYNDGRPAKTFNAAQIKADPDFTFSGEIYSPLEPGSRTVTVTYKYEQITASFSLNVSKRVLTKLTVKNQPSSLVTYSKTSAPDISGLVLHAVYDNLEEEDVAAAKCTVSCKPAAFILGGGNPVTVSYGGKSVTLYYTLAKNAVKGIFVKTPAVLVFRAGFDIDLSKTIVYTEYLDGTLVPLSKKDYTMTEIDKNITGTQNIIVTGGAYSAVFSIYITPYYGKGDIDGNGKVNVSDARLALRGAIGLIKLGGLTLTAADADLSGKAEVTDARLILRNAIGLENFIRDSKVLLP